MVNVLEGHNKITESNVFFLGKPIPFELHPVEMRE
jgi:hypothetical protein